MASMNTRLNIEKLDENIVQKHGGSKQVGLKQLGSKQVGFKQLGHKQVCVNMDRNHVGVSTIGPLVEIEVHGVSNDDTAVAQRWLEDKQPEEKTNTDCLVKEKENVHLGIKVGENIMVTEVPGQKGAEGNVPALDEDAEYRLCLSVTPKGTADVGLIYGRDQGKHVDVDGFVDADYAKDPNKEAEYMALTEAIKESIWLKGLLIELGVNLREIVESKEIGVAKIGTKDNVADAFTKVVPGCRLKVLLVLDTYRRDLAFRDRASVCCRNRTTSGIKSRGYCGLEVRGLISKPLWDVHIVSTKTSDAQSTCVFRFHHSISDGTSLINLLLASSRKASDPKALPTLHGKKVSGPHIRATIVRSQFIVLWNSLVAVVMFILTRFVSLDDINMVKNAMDVTVNDVLAGVLEAGLYRYLNRRYGECVLVMIELRTNLSIPAETGSVTVWSYFPTGVGLSHQIECIDAVDVMFCWLLMWFRACTRMGKVKTQYVFFIWVIVKSRNRFGTSSTSSNPVCFGQGPLIHPPPATYAPHAPRSQPLDLGFVCLGLNDSWFESVGTMQLAINNPHLHHEFYQANSTSKMSFSLARNDSYPPPLTNTEHDRLMLEEMEGIIYESIIQCFPELDNKYINVSPLKEVAQKKYGDYTW
ncbi:hypothetical protein Tco_0418184 [Tanacetum coccineum]